MKKIRVRTIAVFAFAGLTGALLLSTSQNVQQAEDRLAALKSSVQQEKDSVRLLNAEWAYLNNPERLEKLSKKYLDLMPPQPASLLSEAEEIPLRQEIASSSMLANPETVSYQPLTKDTQ